MQIFKDFTFDSAHFLPNVAETHKCRNIHGHTYRLRIYLDGKLHPQFNWVEDFAVVKGIMKPIIERLDHRLLNEISGLENPTCEQIAIWIWNQAKPSLPALCRIELHETPSSGVVYEGE